MRKKPTINVWRPIALMIGIEAIIYVLGNTLPTLEYIGWSLGGAVLSIILSYLFNLGEDHPR